MEIYFKLLIRAIGKVLLMKILIFLFYLGHLLMIGVLVATRIHVSAGRVGSGIIKKSL